MLKSKINKQTQPKLTSVHGRETDLLSAHAFSLDTILLLPSTAAEETKAQLPEPAAPKVSQDPNTLQDGSAGNSTGMITDMELVLLIPGLWQSSERGARCALVQGLLTTTTAWNTRIERISILSKSLLFCKFHLIMYLFQENATSFCCYHIQLKTLERQDKYFHGQKSQQYARNSNQSLLFVSLQSEWFFLATAFTITTNSVILSVLSGIWQSISMKICTFHPRTSWNDCSCTLLWKALIRWLD